MSRFVVGIDLGTTNSALSFADTSEAVGDAPPPIREFKVGQVLKAGEFGEASVLPSFLYFPAPGEFATNDLSKPWGTDSKGVVGTFARDHGAKVPGRLVGSAKSWLSQRGADPSRPILPVNAPDDLTKISPVDASVAYLTHLRDAWNAKNRDEPLERQEVYLTVPASFDPSARDLTLEAARLAGLEHVTLLEEPQAAFYAWLAARGDSWRKDVKVGDLILVCDVGGGTTDFTLIGVDDKGGDLGLTRLAVGEHILLGGDNMDLALANAVGATLDRGLDGLERNQRIGLGHACRAAKEMLFSSPKKASESIVVLGGGSKILKGMVKTELTRSTLNEVVLDGFFPLCEPGDQPDRPKPTGLLEMGLRYAADARITRHLARFLGRQAGSLGSTGGQVHPSAILFNGGVFKANPLRERVAEVLRAWSGRSVPQLDAADLDLAVARGAAYYGIARNGKGVRIRGGVSRSYYVGFESSSPAVPGVPTPIKALCVVPLGMEEGTEADVPSPEIGLIVGEPAKFRFLGSTTRRDDHLGLILDRWTPDELQELAPIETTLHVDTDSDTLEGDVVPVRLHAHVTEVGTLDLWCHSTRDDRRWKLQYHVRDSE